MQRGMSTKGTGGKANPFQDIHESIGAKVLEAKTAYEKLQEIQGKNGNNAKDLIEAQTRLRAESTLANGLLNEAEKLHKTECDKRRSRYSAEELDNYKYVTQDYRRQIVELTQLSKAAYMKKSGFKEQSQAAPTLGNIMDSGMAGGDGRGSDFFKARGPQEEMTEMHKEGLAQIQNRDREFDSRIERIGDGVLELGTIAKAQGEEVQRGAAVLEDVELGLNRVQGEVEGLNASLKNTLALARKSEKLCCDAICVLIMIALIVCLILVAKQAEEQEKEDKKKLL